MNECNLLRSIEFPQQAGWSGAVGVGLSWVYWLHKGSHQFNHFMDQFQPRFYFSGLPKDRH